MSLTNSLKQKKFHDKVLFSLRSPTPPTKIFRLDMKILHEFFLIHVFNMFFFSFEEL